MWQAPLGNVKTTVGYMFDQLTRSWLNGQLVSLISVANLNGMVSNSGFVVSFGNMQCFVRMSNLLTFCTLSRS